MKLINPKAEVLIQPPGLDGIYKQIEIAGRTCYKSEDKITEASSVDFVKRMIESHHTAMLEHGTVYLKTYRDFEYEHNIELVENDNELTKYSMNPYSVYTEDNDYAYVTTNFRVMLENRYISPPSPPNKTPKSTSKGTRARCSCSDPTPTSASPTTPRSRRPPRQPSISTAQDAPAPPSSTAHSTSMCSCRTNWQSSSARMASCSSPQASSPTAASSPTSSPAATT